MTGRPWGMRVLSSVTVNCIYFVLASDTLKLKLPPTQKTQTKNEHVVIPEDDYSPLEKTQKTYFSLSTRVPSFLAFALESFPTPLK